MQAEEFLFCVGVIGGEGARTARRIFYDIPPKLSGNVFLPTFTATFGKYLVAYRLQPEHGLMGVPMPDSIRKIVRNSKFSMFPLHSVRICFSAMIP